MRIAVVGAGAMGCLFGGLLAESGQEVVLIDVSATQLAAINGAGLRLETDRGTRSIAVSAAAAEAVAGQWDLIVLFTKGMHTRAAMAGTARLLGPEGRVLTVQNGLGNAETIAEFLPAGRILAGMTSWPADLKGPGQVASHGTGEVRFWAFDGHADAAVEGIRRVLDAAGLNAVADPEVQTAIWEKVAFNAALNSVCAVSRQTVGAVGASQSGRALVGRVVAEALAVARGHGIPVSPERVEGAVAHAFAHHGEHKPSMLQDVLAGRPTEIASINGAVVERGLAVGVDTPVTRTLHDLVRLAEPGR